jgi:hypothetical protein
MGLKYLVVALVIFAKVSIFVFCWVFLVPFSFILEIVLLVALRYRIREACIKMIWMHDTRLKYINNF